MILSSYQFLRCDHCKMAPGALSPLINAKQWRVVHVVKGSATYTFPDRNERWRAEAGTLFVLPPIRRMLLASSSGYDIQLLFYANNAPAPREPVVEFHPRNRSYVLLREMFHEIYSMRSSKSGDLLEHWLHIFHRDSALAMRQPDPRVKRALALLAMPQGYRLGTSAMAEKVGLTRTHFHRLFLKEQGQSFADASRAHRMSVARSLLVDVGLKPKQVSERIKASTPQAFSREFKAYFGQSPVRFLRHHQAESL